MVVLDHIEIRCGYNFDNLLVDDKNAIFRWCQGHRYDNGSEFLNKECRVLFDCLGIIHQNSCPYTH